MKTRGAITLVFDDGYQAVYDEVVPLLASYGIQAVFAVPLAPPNSKIAGQPIVPAKKWKQIADIYGHEIAAHSVSHTDLTQLTEGDLKTELQVPAQEFSATTIVYPGGAHDDRVVQEAKKWYTLGRTVIHGLETLPPKDTMRLRTINFTRKNFSRFRANVHALRACTQQQWLIETYHMVSSNSSPLFHATDLADLDAHLDFITQLPVRIAPFREIIQSV